MSSSNAKILVTGGAGFIGSNFVRYIYNKYPKYQVYNLDFLTYAGNADNLLDIERIEAKRRSGRRYFFIKGDICDQNLVGNLFKKHKFDYIVNFAAESHVDRSIDSDYHFIRSNLLGVYNLINLAKKYSQPRFVHISTDEIYGDAADSIEKSSHERSPIRPSNPYAASKAAADLLVQSYMRTHKLPSVIVRGSNNFGPYQYPEKLVPLAITNLLEGKDVPVHGDGQQTRMWIHVNDFCRGIDLAMHKGKDFSIYNVAGVETKNIEIVKRIISILGLDHKKHINFVGDRPGGDRRYAPTATKIKKELGWGLQHSLEEHLPEVVKWYVENPEWWKKVKKKKDFKIHYKKQYRSEFW